MRAATDIRRSRSRHLTRTNWLRSLNSFSFGARSESDNSHFGLLLVSNEDTVKPGTGFDTHPHRDMEIVTWVLEGGLVHQDSTGHNGIIYPGLAQRMTAGSGILHSEKNDSWTLTGDQEHADPVHFIQMWVLPDTAGVTPGYEQLDINAPLDQGGWVTLASGMSKHSGARAISIRQKHAALHVARLRPAETVQAAAAPFVHLFVARGSISLEGSGALAQGDAARITGSEGQQISAGADGAELLMWEMDTTLSFR
ncbi:pirin family protein [Streptomyces sp. NBC_01527]|uniref:pirin family protein n=1 Tax=unclassified Streptomyces TaxID=2593676 RepID=UPI002E0F6543|nr:pirin family protein [Streptomyces sp. NBC_01230]